MGRFTNASEYAPTASHVSSLNDGSDDATNAPTSYGQWLSHVPSATTANVPATKRTSSDVINERNR